MTQNLKVLNSKEIKDIYALLESQFGFTEKLDVVWMLSEKKQRLYVFTRDLANIDVSRLRIDTMGLYFGTFYEGLRITIDATQMIGDRCAKNVIDVNKKEMQAWMQGEKLILSELSTPPANAPVGYVIIRYVHENGHDFIGCGKVAGDLILNYIPKTRYIHALYDGAADFDENPL